ncbi:hypothetical protein Acry_1736 [Acidiphilium cryptum JF-5]|uniref:Uncharacterized protein n=1 Tax=Acidiphilium cryptum (strain JF-5) TaxID=349163 RepID=A5FZA8_ACICJ|nr:hypothetical protein Acry_1736 [Acidiphilium cryptum JF-5]
MSILLGFRFIPCPSGAVRRRRVADAGGGSHARQAVGRRTSCDAATSCTQCGWRRRCHEVFGCSRGKSSVKFRQWPRKSYTPVTA